MDSGRRAGGADVVPMAFDQVRHRLTISPITCSRTYVFGFGYAEVGKQALRATPMYQEDPDAHPTRHSKADTP